MSFSSCGQNSSRFIRSAASWHSLIRGPPCSKGNVRSRPPALSGFSLLAPSSACRGVQPLGETQAPVTNGSAAARAGAWWGPRQPCWAKRRSGRFGEPETKGWKCPSQGWNEQMLAGWSANCKLFSQPCRTRIVTRSCITNPEPTFSSWLCGLKPTCSAGFSDGVFKWRSCCWYFSHGMFAEYFWNIFGIFLV